MSDAGSDSLQPRLVSLLIRSSSTFLSKRQGANIRLLIRKPIVYEGTARRFRFSPNTFVSLLASRCQFRLVHFSAVNWNILCSLSVHEDRKVFAYYHWPDRYRLKGLELRWERPQCFSMTLTTRFHMAFSPLPPKSSKIALEYEEYEA